jgi:hypothetical protein
LWVKANTWTLTLEVTATDETTRPAALGSLLLFTEAGVSADVALGPSRTSDNGGDLGWRLVFNRSGSPLRPT